MTNEKRIIDLMRGLSEQQQKNLLEIIELVIKAWDEADNGRIEIRKNTGEEKKKWKMLKRDYRKRQR